VRADDERLVRIAQNDVIVGHDALWPRGLNDLLYVQTPLEVAELRRSCLRHRWPPADADVDPRETAVNLPRLRARLRHSAQSSPDAAAATGGPAGAPRAPPKTTTSPTKSTKSSLPGSHPATATKTPSSATAASSPTKTPRSRPQSAPKASPRPAQTPAARTPLGRGQSASKRSPGGPAASTEAAATSTASSVNGANSSPRHEINVHQHDAASTAGSGDLGISTPDKAPSDSAATAGYPQIPAAV